MSQWVEDVLSQLFLVCNSLSSKEITVEYNIKIPPKLLED